MEKTKSTPLTPEQIARIDALAGRPDEEIDTSAGAAPPPAHGASPHQAVRLLMPLQEAR